MTDPKAADPTRGTSADSPPRVGSALEQTDWLAMYRELRTAYGLTMEQGRLTLLGWPTPDHLAFAFVIGNLPADTIRDALARHGWTDPALLDDLTAWLAEAASHMRRMPFHFAMTGRSKHAVAPPLLPPGPGPLHLAPGLEWLPLLPLAAELAAVIGTLAVFGGLECPELGACTTRGGRVTTETGEVIDASMIWLRTPTEHVWLHELSHLLDPFTDDRTHDQRERFADGLAELLAEHRPADFDAAAPLVEAVDEWAGRTPLAEQCANDLATGLPEPGFGSIVAFATLPLTIED